MPIVGSQGPPSGGNVSDWSHSTIFSTTASTLESKNVPQLTTAWSIPTRCTNRWMAPSAPFIISIGSTTFVTTVPQINSTITSTLTHRLARRVPQAAHTDFEPLSSASGSTRGPPVLASFVAFSTNPGNNPTPGALFDPLYSSCQPYAVPAVYSPGMCPEGQTVAEMTEYQYRPASTDVETYFVASCCNSGMTFGPEWERACIGNISTSFRIFAPFTTRIGDQTGPPIVTYEYTARVFMGSSYGTDGYSTATFSNISTITKGLIAADPVVVGWQPKDLSVFPTAYVASLAQRYSMPWGASGSPPTPASSPNLPKETNPGTNPPSHTLSTGAKAGIGIGVVIGVALFATAIILLLVRRGRRRRPTAAAQGNLPEMEDQDAAFAKKKWFLGGRWRNELSVKNEPQELDSKAVNLVPGSPIELDAADRRLRDSRALDVNDASSRGPEERTTHN